MDVASTVDAGSNGNQLYAVAAVSNEDVYATGHPVRGGDGDRRLDLLVSRPNTGTGAGRMRSQHDATGCAQSNQNK
jgi:hypothetical protein